MNEFEIVHYNDLEGIQVFVNSVEYRTSHFHKEWEFVWLLDQPLVVGYRQKRFILNPGEIILFEPNEPHEFHKVDKEATFLCLQLSPKLLPSMQGISMDENLLHRGMSEDELNHIKKQMADLAEAYLEKQENYPLLCIGTGYLILYEVFRALPHQRLSVEKVTGIDRRNARLKRLIQFVDKHYMQKIRLEDFARLENCSVGYLSKFIKETINQTFREYVMAVRFNCACKLIAEGNMKMLDVCLASGFSDYRYFSRTFQENYHMTPGEYSRCKQKEKVEFQMVYHSLHSIELIYSRGKSLKTLRKYRKQTLTNPEK